MNQNEEYLINTPNIKIKYTFVGGIIGLGIITWLLIKIISAKYGNEVIGSFFERSDYTTQYWVYLQANITSTKNYRVKGDIERVSMDDGSENGDGSYEGGSDDYYLRKVYWDNGGYTEFDDDCDLYGAISTPKGYATCFDNDSNNYQIRLGEKVK